MKNSWLPKRAIDLLCEPINNASPMDQTTLHAIATMNILFASVLDERTLKTATKPRLIAATKNKIQD
jgi:hypothetical protein